MKIIKRSELMALPQGVLYSNFTPNIFDGLYEKGETWGNDWVQQSLIGNIKNDSSDDYHEIIDFALENNAPMELEFDGGGREGFFEDDSQLFAVYELADITQLIKHLSTMLLLGYVNNIK